jgi:hypothetical protein
MSVTSRNIKKEDTHCKSYFDDHLQKFFLVPHSTISNLGDELGFCTSKEMGDDDDDDYSFQKESTANNMRQGEFIQPATKTSLPIMNV